MLLKYDCGGRGGVQIFGKCSNAPFTFDIFELMPILVFSLAQAMTSLQHNLNGIQPQWKMTAIEEDLNGRLPQWKTNSMEDNLNGRQPQ